MKFSKKIEDLAQKVEETKKQVRTEEGTKNAFIMPFIQALGYDVFDINEVVPEYIADVGMKKHEKVDYALMQDKKPYILLGGLSF